MTGMEESGRGELEELDLAGRNGKRLPEIPTSNSPHPDTKHVQAKLGGGVTLDEGRCATLHSLVTRGFFHRFTLYPFPQPYTPIPLPCATVPPPAVTVQ